ncbi:ADP-ribosylglycohydrolase [Deinococcus knuensis]|uniref:ADP-ribosylglycohydrolase n=2 Tax=Deinococcus knuensis TaxID=1837380 RepID=A0ABQ2SC45_9DEIO|nr:ADP-ribosylglycohydrolase [Deinococcus knuensis]
MARPGFVCPHRAATGAARAGAAACHYPGMTDPAAHDASGRAFETLLSLCAADALGAATEFKSEASIRAQYGERIVTYQPGSVFGFAPGEATDDSQMVAATLLGYRAAGPDAPEDARHLAVLSALRDWLGAAPPDVGGLTRRALQVTARQPERLDGGALAWQESGLNGAGNGGLMRIAAPFLAGFRGEALARESAVVTALTHADPRCVHASVFLTAFMEALAASRLAASRYEAAADAALRVMERFDARLALVEAGVLGVDSQSAHAAFRERDRAARGEVRSRVRAGLAGHLTSQSGFVLDTLEAAVAHARGADWLACVEPAALLGDDSDTVACVVGALIGARGLRVPPDLRPALRLGHSWPGWERDWPCVDHLGALLP